MANKTLCTRNHHVLRGTSPLRRNAAAASWGCVVCAAAICAPHAVAQSYPTKPIRMLVGFTVGGGSDIAARSIAVKLTETFGQSVVVDNRTGATGAIAAEMTAQAQPDGYTVMMLAVAQLVANAFDEKLAYDVVRDYVVAFEHELAAKEVAHAG